MVMGDYSLPENLVLSPEVKDLIHQMLLKNPEQRIKLNSIVDVDSGMYNVHHVLYYQLLSKLHVQTHGRLPCAHRVL